MRKAFFTLCCILFFTIGGSAQTPDWQWVQSAYGNQHSNSEGWSVVNDRHGGIYASGWFADTIHLSNRTLIADSFSDFGLLMRYDSSGNVLWAKTCGKGHSQPGVVWSTWTKGLAADAGGNAYITGIFAADSIKIDSFSLYGTIASTRIFTARYNNAGAVLWAKSTGNDAEVTWLAVDKRNNSYIIGDYSSNTMTFGNSVLTNAGVHDVLVAKYDSLGNELWAKSFGGNHEDFGMSIATDADSSIYITGDFSSDSIQFDNITLHKQFAGSPTIFIAKLNSSGNVVWAKATTHNRNNRAYCITVAESGNVYVTGYFALDSVSFGPLTLYPARPGINYQNMFIVRYDAAGNALWSKTIQGNENVIGYYIVTDTRENLYVSGSFSYDNIAPPDTFMVDTIMLVSPPGSVDPMFVFTMDSGGHVMCAEAFPSGGDDQNSVCVDRFGNAYLIGDFESQVMVIANDTMRRTGEEQIFISKFSCGAMQCNLAQPVLTADTTVICASNSAHICAPPGYLSYQWSNGQTGSCVSTSLAGNYYASVTDSYGCSAESNHLLLTVLPTSSVSITVKGDTLTSVNGLTHQWYLNGNLIPGDTMSQIVASQSGFYSVQITDSSGCTSLSNPIGLTGIDKLVQDDFTIYPNPTTGKCHVSINNNLPGTDMEVWNSEGQIIARYKINGLQSDIELNFTGGIYFVRISTPDSVLIKKLVKL